MPLLLPGLIWGIALLILFSRLGIELSIFTVLIAHVLLTLPLVVLTVTTRLQTLDPRVEEAAMSLGATYPEMVYRVILPHVAPALVASGLMAFTISFNEFVLAFFLTGGGFQTLPIYIYSLIRWESSPITQCRRDRHVAFRGDAGAADVLVGRRAGPTIPWSPREQLHRSSETSLAREGARSRA